MLRDDFAPRIYFDGPVELLMDDQSVLCGRANNLSRSGIFVCSSVLLSAGARGELRFELPDGVAICAIASVVRIVEPEDPFEPCGMAFRFDEMSGNDYDLLSEFIDGRLQPACGSRVRLRLGEVGFPITATSQSSWGNIRSIDAELPFLKIGSDVKVEMDDSSLTGVGSIRWVSVHISPQTGVPRLNIGIEIDPAEAFEEELDPVLTDDFAQHVSVADREIRQERKRPAQA